MKFFSTDKSQFMRVTRINAATFLRKHGRNA